MPETDAYSSHPCPAGLLFVAFGAGGITSLAVGGTEQGFVASCPRGSAPAVANDERFALFFREIDEYFLGRPVRFSSPLAPAGSAFDRAVWRALLSIPWGQKTSYGALASLAGFPGAARAVGGACSRNPIPIIIPCHRVLRSDGSLGGYSGGEGVKERLLAVEGISYRPAPAQ